jgi:AraC-like DNA-binding protein
MTVEDIGFALGFSDAANFRHAFHRWTKGSPQDFRRISSGRPAAAEGAACVHLSFPERASKN